MDSPIDHPFSDSQSTRNPSPQTHPCPPPLVPLTKKCPCRDSCGKFNVPADHFRIFSNVYPCMRTSPDPRANIHRLLTPCTTTILFDTVQHFLSKMAHRKFQMGSYINMSSKTILCGDFVMANFSSHDQFALYDL